MRKLTRKLLNKSNESFLLALEVFNKLTIGYRTEAFSILFSNAWELLLKSYIFESSGGKKLSIFWRKKRNRKRESLSIDECLRKVFPNDKDPIRKNVEYVSELRNEAVHLIILELEPYFSRVFQRGVLNYIEYLEKWFSMKLSEQLRPGLISLVSDENAIEDASVLRRRFNKEDRKSIESWIRKFEELEKLGDKATISVDYTVAITRNPKKADIVLSHGKGGIPSIILERYRDIDFTHPYRRKEALAKIYSRLRKGIRVTTHDFESYCFASGVKKTNRNDYYWKIKYGTSRYSDKFVDEFVTAVNANPRVLAKMRKQYLEHLRRGKRKA